MSSAQKPHIRDEEYAAEPRNLRPLSAHIAMATSQLGALNKDGADVCDKDAAGKLSKMLLGIWQYQNATLGRQNLPLDTIYQEGEVSMQTVPGHDYAAGNTSVLLVPSMINKAYVFDLCEQRSMIRWLCAQNINAYLLNWGEPSKDAQQSNVEGVVQERLVPAAQFLHQHVGAQIHMLGYCMGGTLLVGAAALLKDEMKSLTLLAAPWDFHAGSQELLKRIQFWAPTAMVSLKEQAILNSDILQMIFISLDPEMSMQKFSKFADMDQDGDDARLFLAVEDWLNDSVDLPSDVAQYCIEDWFLKNGPSTGQWTIGGNVIDPGHIACPTLIISSDKDRLVEYDCASAIADKIEHAKLINPSCGHIGMMAGKSAVEKVWKPLASWIKSA